MGASDTTRDGNDPAVMYSARLKELRAAQTSDKNLERTFGYSKVVIAFATILAALLLLYYVKLFWLLLIPVSLFVYLSILHEKRLQQIRSRQRAIEFYERGVARTEDRWAGTGETGDRFLGASIRT
jgi:hypothetical protein